LEETFAIPFVKALVLDPGRERFLLQRRIKRGDPYEGFWELPGGKMRRGESAEAALRREVEEEAGIRLLEVLGQRRETLTDGLGRTARVLEPLVTVEITSGPWPYLGHYFACLAEGVPLGTLEGDHHRWIEPGAFVEEFLAPGAPGSLTTLDCLATRIILEGNRLAPFMQVGS
jgi:8-oxo-dGTP pyrophosphatase MutT (NUDIX family)